MLLATRMVSSTGSRKDESVYLGRAGFTRTWPVVVTVSVSFWKLPFQVPAKPTLPRTWSRFATLCWSLAGAQTRPSGRS